MIRPSMYAVTFQTARGGTHRLSRLIRVPRLIRGTGMHQIDRQARIDRGNVAEAADVRGAAPVAAHQCGRSGTGGTSGSPGPGRAIRVPLSCVGSATQV